MGAATLINIAVIVINGQLNYGGKLFLYFIWAIWWLDVLISFVCCWVGVRTMYVSGRVTSGVLEYVLSANLNSYLHTTRITLQKHSLDSMTARWLLPVMTLIVTSASGSILGRAIQVYSQYIPSRHSWSPLVLLSH